MSTFSAVLDADRRKPERHVVLGRMMFASDWPDRPADEIAIGLRRISENDVQTARAEAAKYAATMHDDRDGQVSAFNDALMRWAVVRGTCDPNDVTVQSPIFDGSEENVRLALTSQAIRFVWDELERFHVETSPVVREIGDDELEELAELLRSGLPDGLTAGASKRLRKLLAFCVDELRPEKE